MKLTAANYQVMNMFSSASNMSFDSSTIESTFKMEDSEGTLL